MRGENTSLQRSLSEALESGDQSDVSDTEITLPPKTVQFITLSSKRCKLSEPNH